MFSDLVSKMLKCIIVVIVKGLKHLPFLQTSKSNGAQIFQCQMLVVILSVHLTSADYYDIHSLVSH